MTVEGELHLIGVPEERGTVKIQGNILTLAIISRVRAC